METLEQRYNRLRNEPNSDICQHLPILYNYASSCERVVEFGIGRFNRSSTALLFAQPKVMIGYDIGEPPYNVSYDSLMPLRGITDLRFNLADTKEVVIEPTDLLFIDSNHSYSQLCAELKNNSHLARKYIIMHDTTTFADVGEDRKMPGLWQAVTEFLEKDFHWTIKERLTNNNGLTVLERV